MVVWVLITIVFFFSVVNQLVPMSIVNEGQE